MARTYVTVRGSRVARAAIGSLAARPEAWEAYALFSDSKGPRRRRSSGRRRTARLPVHSPGADGDSSWMEHREAINSRLAWPYRAAQYRPPGNVSAYLLGQHLTDMRRRRMHVGRLDRLLLPPVYISSVHLLAQANFPSRGRQALADLHSHRRHAPAPRASPARAFDAVPAELVHCAWPAALEPSTTTTTIGNKVAGSGGIAVAATRRRRRRRPPPPPPPPAAAAALEPPCPPFIFLLSNVFPANGF
ncbi:hypothetical protein CDD83_3336 [Cordyceps sp. RAO-2017]|nr:hypothetical protein CDD83_3336 [Cordyceps sp. RAO-2017]